jgi:ABC-2 type transport system permease protein
MGPFFKKDFLIIWRDPKGTIISLVSMMVLIIVLGSTLSSYVEKPEESLQMTVAIVNHDNEADGMAHFRHTLALSHNAANPEAALKAQAEQSPPIQSLMQLLHGQSFVKTVELDGETARRRLQEGKVTATVTIPAGFTESTLNKMILNEGSGAVLSLTANHRASMKVDALQNLLDGFIQSLNDRTAIRHALGSKAESLADETQTATAGGREKVAGVAVLTSFQYFSIAISLVNALFLASAAAMKAIAEKREHVFQRILLTGSHPLKYLAGKIGSTFCLSLLNLTILFLLSHLIFNLFPGRSMHFWLGIGLIIIVYSLSVAAFSALFTSLIFRINDAAASGLFTLIIGLLGSIGGSFFPIYILPDWLKQIGEWTPNGLSLSVFIQWIQQDSFDLLATPFLKLAIFSIAIIGLGSWLFPKRGSIG